MNSHKLLQPPPHSALTRSEWQCHSAAYHWSPVSTTTALNLVPFSGLEYLHQSNRSSLSTEWSIGQHTNYDYYFLLVPPYRAYFLLVPPYRAYFLLVPPIELIPYWFPSIELILYWFSPIELISYWFHP
jgi:hypothetical protein